MTTTTAAMVGTVVPSIILILSGAYTVLFLTVILVCVYALVRESHIEDMILLEQIRQTRRVANKARCGILVLRR